MANIVGIDLGTTYSAIATINKVGEPIIVHNDEGSNITPSVVTVGDDGVISIGESARKSLGLDPNTVGRFKRVMGTDKTYEIQGEIYSPTDLSAFVIKKLIKDAESEIGEITNGVVTIPANYSNEAREATMQAAKSAGLNVDYIINEPTAAALYYAYKGGEDLNGKYAVYDLGGGTFDISIIAVKGQDIEVLSTSGVQKLGGDDFDNELINYVQSQYKELTGEKLDDIDFTSAKSINLYE